MTTPGGKERTTLKTQSIWPCTGRGLPSHDDHSSCWWALTPPFHPYLFFQKGGLFSVALSLRSPPVVVNDLPVLRCPDFPPRAITARRGHPVPSAILDNIYCRWYIRAGRILLLYAVYRLVCKLIGVLVPGS